MPAVSVLIPAYNVEGYLPKCLDSVLSQTFKDFEVVLIDDGSTDKTGKVCDEYAARDLRIKVLHQENKGISATRNCCLQQAKGEYVQFVDGDDWVEPNMLEAMLYKMAECNADIVGCCFWEERQRNARKIETYYENRDAFLYDVLQNNWGVLWKLLIKRNIITKYNILFPQGINGGEDFVFVVKALFYARQVVCVNDALYHYNRTNITSFIAKPSYEKILNQYDATELVDVFLKTEKKNFETSVLNRRKAVVKSSLMKCAFFRSYRLYSNVDLWAFRNISGKKTKLLFLCSFLFNLI